MADQCPICGDVHPDTDPGACPGTCNRAWVAAERIAFDEAKSRRPRVELINHGVPMIPAAPVWCRECQTAITDTIGKFPDLCAGLTPGDLNTGRDVQLGAHTAAIVPPTNSPAWDQADVIIRWAVNTEDQLRARIGDPGRGLRPWRTLSSAVWYLTSHATPLLCGPDAVSIGFDVLRMNRRLELVTGTDKLVHRLPGECLVCDRRGTLQRKDGDDMVQCKACGACWDIEYYEFLCHAYAAAAKVG